MSAIDLTDPDAMRAHCMAAQAAYAAKLLEAGHPVNGGWTTATELVTRALRPRAAAISPREILQLAEPFEPLAEAELPAEIDPPAEVQPPKRSAAASWVLEIATAADVTMAELRSEKRNRHISEARQRAYYDLRMKFEWSYPRIGQFLRRDHSSVIHGAKVHAARNQLPPPR